MPRNPYLLASVALSAALVALAVYLPALHGPLGTDFARGGGGGRRFVVLAFLPAAAAEAGKAQNVVKGKLYHEKAELREEG